MLAEQPQGEANKDFFLLTPDFGLVLARAQGIRLLKSKLRFHLAPYSLVVITLVRGREYWRLVGAEPLNDWETLTEKPTELKLVAKVFTLVKKFVRGEGEQVKLFSDLEAAVSFLLTANLSVNNQAAELTKYLSWWELCLVLRLLAYLGYISDTNNLTPVLSFKEWSLTSLELAQGHEKEIIAAINQATRLSHL